MKFFIILSLAAISCVAAQTNPDREMTFDEWIAKYSKTLDPSRRILYRQTFILNQLDINNHNAQKLSYKKSINEFSNLPMQEFISQSCKTQLPAGENNNVESIVMDDKPKWVFLDEINSDDNDDSGEESGELLPDVDFTDRMQKGRLFLLNAFLT
jgi:hypothetical protein